MRFHEASLNKAVEYISVFYKKYFSFYAPELNDYADIYAIFKSDMISVWNKSIMLIEFIFMHFLWNEILKFNVNFILLSR